MECRTCLEELTALLDGELAILESRAVESHVAECRGCKAELESLRYAFQLTDAVLGDKVLPPRWKSIETEIQEQGRSWFDLRRLFGLTWRPAFAAAVLVAVFLVPTYWKRSTEEAELERMFAAYVQERSEQEMLHEGIFNTEPVGWVYYNPYSVYEQQAGKNPYATD